MDIEYVSMKELVVMSTFLDQVCFNFAPLI